MPSLTVHGLPIAYNQFGQPGTATPIVCLPSTGLSGLAWRRLAKLMSERGHPILTVDLIGYGESADWPRARAPFRTEYDIDVTEALLERCPGPVHLVGHSYGGRLALLLGLRRPERLRSLALFEPTCFGVLRSSGDAIGTAELEAYDRDGLFLAEEFGGSEAWVERFVDYWSGAGTFAEFDDQQRSAWLRSRHKMFEEVRETALDAVPHQAYVDALGQLPLLLMSGAHSTLAGRRCCEVLAEVMPRARHIELADVGHMAPVLAGREVAALIAAHIDEVEAAT
ncbi:MAG TPA: alpha/beta hydrolase [Enhygromyxa sp.]|nr:alpha/beta hydrolase [Enhygromyxa sp.]